MTNKTDKTLTWIIRISLLPFILLSLWCSLKVLSEFGKEMLTKEKRGWEIGIVVSK